jgi:quinohemoprotein ethanol dehydrogenase
VHSRGITFYGDKVFAATLDGRLIAIDAKTGKQVWSVRTFPEDAPLYITGAPKAFKGKVLIGNGGTEIGPSRGFVTAYDAETGEEAWKFYIVPGNPADGFENEAMEMAAETWTGEWWKHGGGGNAWHGFTYDPDLDTLYIGTGNGSPWNRNIRSPDGGDNLFLCSIVALDPDTGEYKLALPDGAGRDLGLQLQHGHRAGRSDDRRQGGQGAAARAEERVLLRDRPADRRADLRRAVRRRQLGDPRGPRDRPSGGSPRRALRGGPVQYHAGPLGRAQLARHVLQPGHRTRLHPHAAHEARLRRQGIDRELPVRAVSRRRRVNITWPEEQPRDYPASLQAWDPVAQRRVWEIPQQTLLERRHADHRRQPGLPGPGGRQASRLRCAQRRCTAGRSTPGSASPLRRSRTSIGGRQYVALLVGFGGGYSGLGGPDAADLGWSYQATDPAAHRLRTGR